MRAIAAEVCQAIDLDRLAKEIRAINIEIADGERLVSATTEKLADRRLRIGKKLTEARKAFPRSGPKAAGWGKFLADNGIGDDTALNYMKLAGHVESSPEQFGESHVPTYAEAGIKKPKNEEHPIPPSNVERLISEGVHPREAALQVSSDVSVDWMTELERLGESIRRSAQARFSQAEALDVLCRQHEATLSSPVALTCTRCSSQQRLRSRKHFN